MTLFSAFKRLLGIAPLALCLSGCLPGAGGSADEEKDPYYLMGKSYLNSMDYDRAITAFENALAANPKSAAAHFELGFLYEDKKSNFAAAIYHFEKHLELKPQSNMAEPIRQRIFACKLELAKGVPFALVTRQVQDDMRRLYATNAALHAHIEQLKNELVEQATAFSNQLALVTHAASGTPPSLSQPPPIQERRPPPVERPLLSTFQATPRATVTPRTHIVRSGETLATISRRYNIKLSALQSANSTIDPRRMRPGQVIHIPSPRN